MQSPRNQVDHLPDWKELHEDLWARILNDNSFTTVERQRLSLICKGWAGIINNVNLLPAHVTLQLKGNEYETSCLPIFTERAKLRRTLLVFNLSVDLNEDTSTTCLSHLILGSASSLQIQELNLTYIHGPWLSILPAYTKLRVLSIRFPSEEEDFDYSQMCQLSTQTSLISRLQELRLVAYEFSDPLMYNSYTQACNSILQALLKGPIECLQLEPTPDETAIQFWSLLNQLPKLRALSLTHYDTPIIPEEISGQLPALRHLHVSYWKMAEKLASYFPNLEVLGFSSEDAEQEDGSYFYIKLVLGVLLKLPAVRVVFLNGNNTEIEDMSKLWQLMLPNRVISFKSVKEDTEFPGRNIVN